MSKTEHRVHDGCLDV